MNGLFCTDWVCENLKGYYPFKMFNRLYEKENAVHIETHEAANIYAASAKSENETSVMFTYFDENNDMALVETRAVAGRITLEMSLFSTILVNVK